MVEGLSWIRSVSVKLLQYPPLRVLTLRTHRQEVEGQKLKWSKVKRQRQKEVSKVWKGVRVISQDEWVPQKK